MYIYMCEKFGHAGLGKMSLFETNLFAPFEPGQIHKTLSSTPSQPSSSVISSRPGPARRPRGGESKLQNIFLQANVDWKLDGCGKLQDCFTRTTVATAHRTPSSVTMATQVVAQVQQTSAITHPVPAPQ